MAYTMKDNDIINGQEDGRITLRWIIGKEVVRMGDG
jgi:hypothetical protein